MVTTQKFILSGEIRSSDRALIDEYGVLTQEGRDLIEQSPRETVKRIGYGQTGFHWKTPEFQNNLHAQSAHIAQGVDESGNKDEGAGDRGIMFGYASDETPDLLPATLYYSHRILERMEIGRAHV